MFRKLTVSNLTFSRSLPALAAMVLFTAALAPVPLDAQYGPRVVQRNLAEMVSDAGSIVYGRVLGVRIEPHPQYTGLKTAVVDLEIIEMLKGQTGAPFSFRQYIWDDREAHGKLGYKVGQEVLLLMYKAHPQTGLSSPTAGDQGRFRVMADEQGNRMVTNGVNNGGIFRGMDPARDSKLQALAAPTRTMITQHRGGPIAYDQLKSVILALAGNSSN